jgi:di/tricarboxylate transporter
LSDQTILFALLAVVLALLIWGRWRYDFVAFGALLAALLIGVVPAEKAFDGFVHPATVIIALVLIVSRGLTNAGVVDHLGRLLNATPRSLPQHIGLTSVIAAPLGVSPDPFLMAVAISASCAFLTPIGHKNNILVLGPGGYRFGDYWRMGLPLEIIILVVSVPLLLIVWPL